MQTFPSLSGEITKVLPPVVAFASHGLIFGEVLTDVVCMRLPNSVTFEKLQAIKLDRPLDSGECGTAVHLVGSIEPRGFVVASSLDKTIAYITAAAEVLSKSCTRWHVAAYGSNVVPDPRRVSSTERQNQHKGASVLGKVIHLQGVESALHSHIPDHEAERIPPFKSLGRAVDPFRTMFQISFPRLTLQNLRLLRKSDASFT